MSYTLRWGKTYDEWAEEKAKRIFETLKYYYIRREPIKLKDFVFQVYRERLVGVTLLRWKPVFETFTDFKPSPFIKNFIKYVIEELKNAGYIRTYFIVDVSDITCVSDIKCEKTKIKKPTLKITIVEVEDIILVRDAPKPEKKAPETKITRRDMVEHLPPYEFIKEMCRWRDPPLEL